MPPSPASTRSECSGVGFSPVSTVDCVAAGRRLAASQREGERVVVVAVVRLALPVARQTAGVRRLLEAAVAQQLGVQAELDALEHELEELAVELRADAVLDLRASTSMRACGADCARTMWQAASTPQHKGTRRPRRQEPVRGPRRMVGAIIAAVKPLSTTGQLVIARAELLPPP